ncbi:MAG: aldo/keto reductase [Polyangiaceae bacterium]|nr:aldo/keto reductase [Polyangiaceae bacterium]
MQKMGFGGLGGTFTRIGIGTMPLAVRSRPPEHEAIRLIHRALDAGVNWIDTADTYSMDDDDLGYGERLVARALGERSPSERRAILVITKGGWRRPGGQWTVDGSPRHLRRACEGSLKALGVSSIFLYVLHFPDPKVDYVDSGGALVDLQREGKVQHIGISNVDVGLIKDAQSVAVVRMVQNQCNLFDRFSFTNGVVDYCIKNNIAFVAHSALGGHTGHARVQENRVIAQVAARRDLTPHQVVLLWLLAQSPHLFAVTGASRLDSLESNLRALDASLSPDDMADLSAAFPQPMFPRAVLVRTRNELRRAARIVRRRITTLATSR